MKPFVFPRIQPNILKPLIHAIYIRLLRPILQNFVGGNQTKGPILMSKVSDMELINKWVAEFVIRRQHNPRVFPTNLLSSLKFGDNPDCINLKISSVLRDISNSLIQGTVYEETLDLLEILEKLLLQQHSVLMDSHKSAYCWTAVECTVRFMWPLNASDGLFSDAIERIWIKRIGNLKESGSGLVTYDLLKWESDLKKAVEDPELYQRIRESNVRYTAISFLTQLLKEQWALLGSSSLESVAQRSLKRKADSNVEGDSVRDPNAVDESRRRLESDNTDNANERCGTREGEDGLGSNRDVEGVGCLENDGIDKVNEQHTAEERTTDAQEQEHEPSLGTADKMDAQALKDSLLEIERQINPSTRQVQEPNNVNVTPQPARVNRTGTSGQDHNEAPDNVNGEGSDSYGTRPHLPTPVPLNVSPLRKTSLPVRRPRRPTKFWTPEEVEALREGVKEFGKSWKCIKNANPAVFAERTEVDLKDKWRNLTR